MLCEANDPRSSPPRRSIPGTRLSPGYIWLLSEQPGSWFDFDHDRGLARDLIAHLGTLDFVTAKENVVFLGPPGTGKTHLAIELGIRACGASHRVLFATASGWVALLAAAHHASRLKTSSSGSPATNLLILRRGPVDMAHLSSTRNHWVREPAEVWANIWQPTRRGIDNCEMNSLRQFAWRLVTAPSPFTLSGG